MYISSENKDMRLQIVIIKGTPLYIQRVTKKMAPKKCVCKKLKLFIKIDLT